MTVQPGRARGGRDETGDHPREGGLARAVAPDHAEAAEPQIEVQALQHRARLERQARARRARSAPGRPMRLVRLSSVGPLSNGVPSFSVCQGVRPAGARGSRRGAARSGVIGSDVASRSARNEHLHARAVQSKVLCGCGECGGVSALAGAPAGRVLRPACRRYSAALCSRGPVDWPRISSASSRSWRRPGRGVFDDLDQHPGRAPPGVAHRGAGGGEHRHIAAVLQIAQIVVMGDDRDVAPEPQARLLDGPAHADGGDDRGDEEGRGRVRAGEQGARGVVAVTLRSFPRRR